MNSNERDTALRLIVVAALSLGFMARAATYRSPLFDFHSWRQADTATIARNFATEYFNPLYPQIDARGSQRAGFVETGFEIHAFAVAALSKIVGFSPELGRLLNAALFPVAGVLLFRFARTRYGDEAAVVSLAIYALGLPLTMYMDRAFMNESMLALLTLACLRAAQQYCAHGRLYAFAGLIATSALIAMVKPTYLIVWAPVIGLFLERFGRSALVRWDLWIAASVSITCGGLWFWHARSLAAATGLSFGLSDKLLDADILLSVEYPLKIARRLVADILGPVGVACAAVGAVLAVRRRMIAEVLGIVAFGLYLMIVVGGNFHHNYYQLPIVPVATVLCGLGINGVAEFLARWRHWDRGRQLGISAALVWLAVMSAFARNVSAHNWYELDASRLRLCDEIRPRITPSDRVVFLNERSPDVLFCLDRKGWLLNEHESTLDHVRKFAQQGGSIAVVHRSDAVRQQLNALATPLVETPDYVVYRLHP